MRNDLTVWPESCILFIKESVLVCFWDLQFCSIVGDLKMNGTARPPSLKIERTDSLKDAAKAASRQREREIILKALWNRKRAARELQIGHKILLYKLKQIATSETGISEVRSG